jgi:tetratricopeptide (TPR) repeat protein
MALDAQTDEVLRQARRLANEARIPEAIACYLQALARRPELPNVWYNLARLQRQAGQPAAALSSYQEALSRRISRPEEAHLNRAVIFSDDLLRPESAER